MFSNVATMFPSPGDSLNHKQLVAGMLKSDVRVPTFVLLNDKIDFPLLAIKEANWNINLGLSSSINKAFAESSVCFTFDFASIDLVKLCISSGAEIMFSNSGSLSA